MFGVILIVSKIILSALSAAFGILGLLYEFRDENKKVTLVGKVALIGICATFLVSGAITVLEEIKSHTEEENQKAVRATADARVIAAQEKAQEEIKSALGKSSRKILRPLLENIPVDLFYVTDRQMPKYEGKKDKTKFQEMPFFIDINFYQDTDCNRLSSFGDLTLKLPTDVFDKRLHNRPRPGIYRTPNGSIVGDDPSRFILDRPHEYFLPDSIVLEVARKRGTLVSVDDIPGSTIKISTTEVNHDFSLDSVHLKLAEGVDIHVPTKDGQQSVTSLGDGLFEHTYCYTFPNGLNL